MSGMAATLATLATLVILWMMFKFSRPELFRYDTRNPTRRFCKKCGQQQNKRGTQAGNMWVDIVPILKPDCECHDHY